MPASARLPFCMTAGPVHHGITRDIWGDGDSVLLIFAGAAAEFALNRAVDWLFFTGALPRDPLGRLFRTVRYAQNIAFAGPNDAACTLERIRRIHQSVEHAREKIIPGWAHRAVLYMLIDYSERAGQLLWGPLDRTSRESLYADFRRIGEGLGIGELPADYAQWRRDRAQRLKEDLTWSPLTAELYQAYRRHLGPWRYDLLRRLQSVLVPPLIRELLRLPAPATGLVLIAALRTTRVVKLETVTRRLVVPPRYWRDLLALER